MLVVLEDDWDGLTDFFLSMAYWREVQQHLSAGLESRSNRILLYENPYLDGERVRIPNGPAYARDAEGYSVRSILKDAKGFSIRSSGVSRADSFTDEVKSWYGSFALASKRFLYMNVCTFTLGTIDQDSELELSSKIEGMGLLDNWASREVEGPRGFPRQMNFDTSNPSRFYVTYIGDTATSQMITKTFREINEVYSNALGLERFGIPLPDTSI